MSVTRTLVSSGSGEGDQVKVEEMLKQARQIIDQLSKIQEQDKEPESAPSTSSDPRRRYSITRPRLRKPTPYPHDFLQFVSDCGKDASDSRRGSLFEAYGRRYSTSSAAIAPTPGPSKDYTFGTATSDGKNLSSVTEEDSEESRHEGSDSKKRKWDS